MNKQLDHVIHILNNRGDIPPLTPRRIWNEQLDTSIAQLNLKKHSSPASAIALMAGLHLKNDSLNRSHSYSQQIEDDATGSYWHGLMHRMEQDFSNSKYWFRCAGDHPVKTAMKAEAAKLLAASHLDTLPSSAMVDKLLTFGSQHGWNASDFVDLLSSQERGQGSDDTRQLLEKLQKLEIDLLFQYSYEAYLGQ